MADGYKFQGFWNDFFREALTLDQQPEQGAWVVRWEIDNYKPFIYRPYSCGHLMYLQGTYHADETMGAFSGHCAQLVPSRGTNYSLKYNHDITGLVKCYPEKQIVYIGQ